MPGAVVEWPFGLLYDFDYVFRQAAHGKPIVNGYSGFFPPTYTELEAQLKQRPIPDAVWETMGDLGASMLVYHAHEGPVSASWPTPTRSIARSRRGGWSSFGAFRTERASTSCSCLRRRAWPEQARRGAAAPEETRRLYAAAVADLRRNVAPARRPRSAPSIFRRKARRSLPGSGSTAGRSTIRGSPRSASRRSRGLRALAMVAGAWPGLAEAFPGYPDAGSRSSYGFPLPELPDGPHTLRVTSRRAATGE